MTDALKSILAERRRQDKIWGQQNHFMCVWLQILLEEIGEFCAEQQASRNARSIAQEHAAAVKRARVELVQVAAVALAMLESFDRNERISK